MVSEMNRVKVSGTVNMISSGRNMTSIWVVTDGARIKKAIPQFVFRNGDISCSVKVGDRVTVEGHMHKRFIRNGDDVIYEQEIIGDEISHTPRALKVCFPSEDIPDEEGGYLNDENYALISGEVSHIFQPKPDVAILTLKIRSEKSTENCEITCFRRQAEVARLLNENDKILAVGYIQTILKRNEKGRTVYQDIVVRDIVKISE